MESRTQNLPNANNRSRSAAASVDILPSKAKGAFRKNELSEQVNSARNPTEKTAEERQSISEYAHRLWENDGRPDGKDLEYWFRAEAELNQRTAI